MGNFTKKKIKTTRELIKDIPRGDLSITKNQFSLQETVGTIKMVTETYVDIMGKVDEIKAVNSRVFNKNDTMS